MILSNSSYTASSYTACGTTPLCAYCGRPVLGLAVYGHGGEVYHFECTQPPNSYPQFTVDTIKNKGCVCSPGAEVTCQGFACPRWRTDRMNDHKSRDVDTLNLQIIGHGPPITVRSFLKELLKTVWNEQEGFNSKRPFGNSDDYDIVLEALPSNLTDQEKHDMILRAIERMY